MNLLVTEFLHVEARCDRLPIGSSATCASSYRSRQTPTDHAQSFSRRIVDINPVSHAKSSTRARLFCTQPLLPFSLRFRKPISTLLAIRRLETTNYETWKLRPFPDARERNFIIERRFLIVFFAKEIFGFFADFTSLCIGKSLRERASWKWQRWYNLFVPNPAGKMFDNGTNLIADSNRLSGKPGNSPLIGFDEGGCKSN